MVAEPERVGDEAPRRLQPIKSATTIPPPLEWDVWIYRIVVISLGLAVLGALSGAFVLALKGKPIPDVLVALGSAAVGALAGLLAPPPAGRK